MKKIFSLAVTVLLLVICAGCGESVGNSFEKISADDAKKIMSTEKNFVILDVRTKDEFDKKHIPNAILLPLAEIEKGNFTEKLPDKNQKILIYCRTGRRSANAAQILVDNGYKNIFDFGGIVDWNGEVEGTEAE